MATAGHGKAFRAYFDGFRVSQSLSTGDLTIGVDAAECTTFEGTAKEYKPGKAGMPVNLNGIMDVADNGWDELESTYVIDGSIHHVSMLPQGNGAAALAYVTQVIATGDSRAFDQAGVAMLNFSGESTTRWGRGQVITTGEKSFTEDGSDSGDSVGTTAATETMIVILHVVAYSGLDSIKLQIDESSDDGSGDAYAQITGLTIDCNGLCTDTTDDVTFTGLGSALLYKTGATEEYKRITADCTGTGSATVLATYCKALT